MCCEWCEALSCRWQISETRGSSNTCGNDPFSPSFLQSNHIQRKNIDSYHDDVQRRRIGFIFYIRRHAKMQPQFTLITATRNHTTCTWEEGRKTQRKEREERRNRGSDKTQQRTPNPGDHYGILGRTKKAPQNDWINKMRESSHLGQFKSHTTGPVDGGQPPIKWTGLGQREKEREKEREKTLPSFRK